MKSALVLSAACVLAAALAPAASLVDPNNPTGTHGLILIDKLGSHIRFFDPVTFQELSSFETEKAPHDLAFSPDHKTVYVPIYGDGVYGRNPHPGHLIAIIDLASRQMTGTIDVSPYQAPHGIQVDAAGTLYVTCDLSRKLLVIDPKKRSIEAAIDTEGTGHWVAVLPNGTKAYVANKNDKPFVSVIDLKARKLIGRIPAPNGTEGIVASPDGKYVVAVDHVNPVLLAIDPETDTVLLNLPLEGSPKSAFKPRFTPDGSKLLVCSLSGTVNIIDVADAHGPQTILTVGKDPMGFAISPDGKTALVANHGDGTVSVISLAEGKVVSTFKGGTGIETLSYY
jgi:DNA-binding beta-propeller fold protein YncE